MATERDRIKARTEGVEAPAKQVRSPLAGYFTALAIMAVVLIAAALYFSLRGKTHGESTRDNPAQQTTPNPANRQQ